MPVTVNFAMRGTPRPSALPAATVPKPAMVRVSPAFDGEGPLVIGVVSWSTAPEDEEGCGGLTGLTPLLLYRGWIIDTARKFGSPLAP